MNTDRLRADLHELADRAATPSPQLADDVLEGQRAERHRWLAGAGAGVGVVLVVGLVPVVANLDVLDDGRTAAPTAAADQPTRGSLAADTDVVAALRELPWTYQQWRSPDGSGYTMDPQPQPAEDWTSVTTDLAEAYTAEQRDVLFAGDVPGGRWALITLDSAGADTAAWFTGPVGAEPAQMTISGMPQTVTDGEPLAHVDLTNSERPLVVVATPGDRIQVSDRATLAADGSVERVFEPVPDEDGDGVVITTLDRSTRFGVAASVSVERDGERVWRTSPSVQGRAPGIDKENPRGWPVGVRSRFAMTVDPGYDYLDQALITVLGPFGLELEDLSDADGMELTQVFQGSADGPLTPGATPLITVYSIRLPSGARVLVGGYTHAPGDTTAEGRQPDQSVTYLDVRAADVPVDDDVVAIDMDAGTRTLVISGPEDATTAVVLDAGGAELQRLPLVEGVTSLPFPSGASSVQVLDRSGRPDRIQPISQGRIGSWGDYGGSTTTSFSIPIPPPA